MAVITVEIIGTGPVGPRGEQGPQGIRGETGPQGPKGDPGDSIISEQLKRALLQIASKAQYIDEHRQDYYDDLYDALYPLTAITAVYEQSGTVYTTDTLDSLKTDLTVTAVYDDGTTQTIPGSDYTLSGNLTEGTSTITVSYGGKTATFSVTVTHVARTFSVANNLFKCANSNSATAVSENEPYTGTITADAGYTLNGATVDIMMGGASATEYYSDGVISIPAVTGDVNITVTAIEKRIDLLNVTWTNHAITCGQDTNSYNAWSPHNLQYDPVYDCFVFLQCHSSKHVSGVLTTWTLSVIDPYDPTNVENISIPSFNGLGMLFIEDGVWTLMPRNQSFAYRSSDRGVTWQTLTASIPQNLFGVYKCGDTYFAGNDTNVDITYYKSLDLLNWTTETFDSSLGYSVLCETTFCEYGGKYWAFNRTNDSTLGHPVILQSTDEGSTWTLFSDQMLHGYRSTVSCYPFKNFIMVADIDRDNGYLYYNKFDGTAFETLNTWTVPFGGNDFHNVNIASNYKDTVILEFMHAVGMYELTGTYTDARACDNVMLVGSTKGLPALNFQYFDTANELSAYASEHWTNGVNGRTYTWNGLVCQFGETITEFVDEIEVPLNLMQFRNEYFAQLTLKNGSHIVQAWNNSITSPAANAHVNYIYKSSLQAIVTVNGSKYAYVSRNRANELPVLTKVNYYANVSLRGWSTNANDITGADWQESLGFRRVISINSITTGNSVTPFQANSFLQGDAHVFAMLTYTSATAGIQA